MEKTWEIVGIEAAPQINGFTNVVKTVGWRLIGTEDGHTTAIQGSINLEFNPANSEQFVPYENLTPEIVVNWIKSSLGEAQVTVYENLLQEQLNMLKAPQKVSLPLPWLPKYVPPQEPTPESVTAEPTT